MEHWPHFIELLDYFKTMLNKTVHVTLDHVIYISDYTLDTRKSIKQLGEKVAIEE